MPRVIPFSRLAPHAPQPDDFAVEDLEYLGDCTTRTVDPPSDLLEVELELHSFAEHRAALDGPAFDPVHLLLRSQIPAGDEQDEGTAAAILKARHDLAFWGPMVELGLGGVFAGHLGDLRSDLELLDRFPPHGATLRTEWEDARAAVIGAIPSPKARAA